MSRTIQIRNVPEELDRRVKSRAALSGMSLSEFLLREIERILQRPSKEELLRRIKELPAVEPSPSPAEAVREERERR